jgi:hypothetical protein
MDDDKLGLVVLFRAANSVGMWRRKYRESFSIAVAICGLVSS